MTASAQPSKGCRSRVIITESGKSRRWVVCRPFLHAPLELDQAEEAYRLLDTQTTDEGVLM
jgi:hypothetical protein